MTDIKNKILAKNEYGFDDLCDIMTLLRGPDGCPWDREQDHKSIRKNLIEETYEVVEAIDTSDYALMREELGDLLLQVVFHAEIAKDSDNFDIDDVCNDICKKLIIRHPHIFSDTKAESSGEVLKNWDEIKKQTKNIKSLEEQLDSVSKSLPSLMRAYKAGEKAAKAGLDFKSAEEALEKVSEETEELKQAVIIGETANIEEELGDLLFSAVNVARLLKIEPEEALYKSTEKFILRAKGLEKEVLNTGKNINDIANDELDKIWESQKTQKSKKNS